MRWTCLLLAGAALLPLADTGCATSSPYEDAVGPGPGFCSPFNESGELVEWAQVAIDKGIGLQINPYTEPYPSNKTQNYEEYNKPYKHESKLSKKDRAMADRSARLVGGWGFIEDTTTLRYASATELARAMYVNNQDHPRYSEVLAAVKMIYPQLKTAYTVGK